MWERRAPLAPSHVRKLVRKGIKVIVQPSNRRAYPMQAYASCGAIIQEDMSDCSVIFGVKQVPIDSLMSNKTFCFFSHTIKVRTCFAERQANKKVQSKAENSTEKNSTKTNASLHKTPKKCITITKLCRKIHYNHKTLKKLQKELYY